MAQEVQSHIFGSKTCRCHPVGAKLLIQLRSQELSNVCYNFGLLSVTHIRHYGINKSKKDKWMSSKWRHSKAREISTLYTSQPSPSRHPPRPVWWKPSGDPTQQAVLDHGYNETKDKLNASVRDWLHLKVIQQCHGHLQYPSINTAHSVHWKQ